MCALLISGLIRSRHQFRRGWIYLTLVVFSLVKGGEPGRNLSFTWMDGGLPVVNLRINQESVSMILDTGANSSLWFNPRCAAYSEASDPGISYPSGAPQTVTMVHDCQVVMGDFLSGQTDLAVVSGRSYRVWSDRAVAGLCGLDLIGRTATALLIDTFLAEVQCASTFPDDRGLDTMMINDGRLCVRANDPLGVPRDFLVDTGAIAGLYLHNHLEPWIDGLRSGAREGIALTLSTPGGASRHYALIYISDWEFGGIEFHDLPIFVALDPAEYAIPQPNIIGMAVLRRFNLGMDFQRARGRLIPNRGDGYLPRIRALSSAEERFKAFARIYDRKQALCEAIGLSGEQLARRGESWKALARETGQLWSYEVIGRALKTLPP